MPDCILWDYFALLDPCCCLYNFVNPKWKFKGMMFLEFSTNSIMFLKNYYYIIVDDSIRMVYCHNLSQMLFHLFRLHINWLILLVSFLFQGSSLTMSKHLFISLLRKHSLFFWTYSTNLFGLLTPQLKWLILSSLYAKYSGHP